MPDDTLALDPDQEPQSLHEFIHEEERNPLEPRRKIIYIYDHPALPTETIGGKVVIDLENDTDYDRWTRPRIDMRAVPSAAASASRPVVEDLAAYVQAFYHGMEVRVAKDRFRLVPWKEPTRRKGAKTKVDQYIGLAAKSPTNHPDTVTRIRHRGADSAVPEGQINLNDILDGLLEALPSDAYAAMLLMHHDLYEDDDDDFCCGRAYGGSRICVFSTFRDNPILDQDNGIAMEHTWPNAHCRKYADDLWDCMNDDDGKKKTSAQRRFRPEQMVKVPKLTAANAGGLAVAEPLVAAVLSASALIKSKGTFTANDWSAIWLGRACIIAVHKLGHCFGLDHCVYYACVMQGTASVAEDTQQPPYLCPVCQAKVAYALAVEPATKNDKRQAGRTVAGAADVERLGNAWTRAQYEALERFCESRTNAVMFKGLKAWLQARKREM